VGQHSSASASRLLGLDGFEILAVDIVGGEWQLAVQTTATVVGCGLWGAGRGPWPPHGPGPRPADRRAAGRALVAQAHLALSRAGLWGPDLDRADSRDPPSGGADRAGPRRGVSAGRQGRPRGGRGGP
jgi:hypothetical protein